MGRFRWSRETFVGRFKWSRHVIITYHKKYMILRMRICRNIYPPHGNPIPNRTYVVANNKKLIITTYNLDSSIQIYIGSETIYCIDAQLFKANDGTIMEMGLLNKLRWDAACSTNFEQGRDTVMILELLMTYIHDTYPGVAYLKFTDLSTKRCDNGTPVSLAAMKFFTSGRTWYESRFHAVIAPQDEARYVQMVSRINSIKMNTSWNMVKNQIHISTLPISESDLQNKYDTSDTWQEWFSWILDQMTAKNAAKAHSQFCIWLSEKGWFDRFINAFVEFNLFDMKFLIHPSHFALPYTVQKGGQRRTQKNKWKRGMKAASSIKYIR